MKRKNKQVENRLRSNEAKDILLTVIQKDALQNMSWLTENIDAALDAEDQKEKAREIMELVKAQAYYDASQIQAKKHSPATAIRGVLGSVRWKVSQAPQLATTLLVFLILGSFLLTKPGIAFAKDAYAIVAQWINGMLNIQQNIEAQADAAPLNYADLPEYFTTFKEAAEYLQRPVAVVESDKVEIQTLQTLKEDNFYITLKTSYVMKDGQAFIIWQDFYDSAVLSVASTTQANEKPLTYTLPNGAIIYHGTGVDGDAYGQASWEYGQLFITGTKLPLETLRELIQTIDFDSP